VICQSRTGTEANQCDARDFCGASYHICTSTEFINSGGDSTPTLSTFRAWIAGCISYAAASAKYGAPIDDLCSDPCAQPGTHLGVSVHYNCSSDPDSEGPANCDYLGLTTSDACHRMGEDHASTEAYWYYFNPIVDYVIDAAVCCPNSP
jgi:hypothetical protein